MKACMFWILVILATAAPGSDLRQSSDQIALGIIIDTSWSCTDDMPNIRVLSRQAFSACDRHSYIEILSAHPGKTRIRLAQTIRTDSSQEVKNVSEILNKINTGFLSCADISEALDLAAKRLDTASRQKGFDDVAILIFTDGRLSDTDSKQVVAMSEKLQNKGWHVFVTGDSQANRHLLIGANEKKLTWSLISEANPVVWLKQVVEGKPTKQPITEKTAQSEVLFGKAANKSKQPIAPGRESANAEVLEPEKVVEPVITEAVKDKPISTEESAPMKAPTAKKERIEDASKQQEKRLITNLQKIWPWLAGLGVALLLGIVAVVMVALRNGRQWQSSANSLLGANQSKTEGALVIEFNGQKYGLGQLSRFTSADIGSGPNNTVKIPHKSVIDKHLRLFRKSEDLMIKNLARSAIIISGTEVKPGQKHKLSLPVRIKLSDDVQFSIRLVPNKIPSNSKRSDEDEATK